MSDKRIETVERIIDKAELPEKAKTDQVVFELVDLVFEYIEDEDRTVAFINDYIRFVDKRFPK